MLRALLVCSVLVTLGCGGDGGAGSADAGDASALDSAVLDAGASDAAGSDAAADADVSDAATTDGSTADAASPDAATSDASVMDASSDAAVSWPEGCGSPAPAWADLTVGEPGTCPAFSACGGDIVGAWDVSGGCFEFAVESTLSSCPGASVTRRTGRGRGCVAFGADGVARRVAESEVEIDVFVPAVCASFVSCSTIESQIRARGLDANCPADAAGNCECVVRSATRIDDTDTYSTTATEIVGGTSGKRWEYCVTGSQLNYRDTSPSGSREPGVVELTRR
ncbi:MAG: hypothetical protein GXP55_17915 [Deltaproteobacteria bacterium]|nr:hypothetical protein [Deltaproteobacteria bacterium]